MKNILLAGATGYLGSYILEELLNQGYSTRAVVRNEQKVNPELKQNPKLDLRVAEVTKPESLIGVCQNIDVVITTIGITRQKDHLTYMDVDYQANSNLLHEALAQGVKKMICISVLHGDKLRNLAICDAKERFVDELTDSGLDYCIVRPNGFFSDMAEFYEMAKKGTIYLFGNGELKANPIHGADLAVECVRQIQATDKVFEIGGPETLTQNEIAETAFQVAKKPTKIIHLPDWIRRLALRLGKLFLSRYKYGPFEFFLNVMVMDMQAPEYGYHRLKDFFESLDQAENNKKNNS